MSRAKATPAASTAKPATNSGKQNKPVPTAWKDRLLAEDYEELKHTFEVFDEDGSGTIDPVEINKVLEELGLASEGALLRVALDDRIGRHCPTNCWMPRGAPHCPTQSKGALVSNQHTNLDKTIHTVHTGS